MTTDRSLRRRRSSSGFTLVEMIVVTLLLMIAMVGLLAVFDASARINKNETDVADAQGSVRYGIYQMTRAIRMAGVGGLYVTQAVLNHADVALPGVTISGGATSYDNVPNGSTVTDITGRSWPVRPGTDMIEVHGVLFSPLLGFVEEGGCAPCTGSQALNVSPLSGNALVGQFLNNDPTIRPQFAAIDAYTQGAATNPMMVIVQDAKGELHVCADTDPTGLHRYPQPPYNVGALNAPTNLVGGNTFGTVDFTSSIGQRIDTELPSDPGTVSATPITILKRAGILDDVIFFITTDRNQDPNDLHPFLAQGIRRGNAFDVSRLADDVEDMQVAYGIDTNGDGAVTRLSSCAPTVNDPDLNFSTTAGCDEWFPNAVGEAAPTDDQFQLQSPFNPAHDGAAIHCPRLHAVMISLLAKARDSDPTYRGPAAQGYKVMNSTATPITPGNFRRRIQTLKINLRNYAFQG